MGPKDLPPSIEKTPRSIRSHVLRTSLALLAAAATLGAMRPATARAENNPTSSDPIQVDSCNRLIGMFSGTQDFMPDAENKGTPESMGLKCNPLDPYNNEPGDVVIQDSAPSSTIRASITAS